jgi:hypothetical protein
MWTGDNATGDINCALSKRPLMDLQELLKQLTDSYMPLVLLHHL